MFRHGEYSSNKHSPQFYIHSYCITSFYNNYLHMFVYTFISMLLTRVVLREYPHCLINAVT
jgi:hypothetical protein